MNFLDVPHQLITRNPSSFPIDTKRVGSKDTTLTCWWHIYGEYDDLSVRLTFQRYRFAAFDSNPQYQFRTYEEADEYLHQMKEDIIAHFEKRFFLVTTATT